MARNGRAGDAPTLTKVEMQFLRGFGLVPSDPRHQDGTWTSAETLKLFRPQAALDHIAGVADGLGLLRELYGPAVLRAVTDHVLASIPEPEREGRRHHPRNEPRAG